MKKIISISAFLILNVNTLFATNINIYAQVSANINFIKAQGSKINKGDVLVKLDNTQAQAKLDEIIALANYKKVIFNDASKVLGDYTELYESTVASKKELDLAKLNEQKARYSYHEQKAKITYYKEELKKYVIKSPFKGIVIKIINPRNTTNIKSIKSLMEISNKY